MRPLRLLALTVPLLAAPALAGTPTPPEQAERLLLHLNAAAIEQGLPPDLYAVRNAPSETELRTQTLAVMERFAAHVSTGRVAPSRQFGGLGEETRPSVDLAPLRTSVGKGDLSGLDALAPVDPAYAALSEALRRYRRLARDGGWPAVPPGPSLKPDMDDPRVPVLRARLIVEGDLPADAPNGTVFAPALVEGLKRFQLRHGLTPDGAVGPRTLAALNVTVAERIRQIALNLERHRWLARRPEPTRIDINLAAAELRMFDNGQAGIAMRVIVGDPKHPTPTFTTSTASLVVNPPWRVPSSIATKEILPKLQKDPAYLLRNDLRIVEAFPDDDPRAAGIGIAWRSMTSFPWRLRQLPGDDNALGVVKFNLVNSDDIYLHDTDNRALFARIERALSHGCVRLEKPLDLARHLLPPESLEKFEQALADGSTKTLPLARRIPVRLLYFTAWTDPDGVIQFREDLYGHDKRLAAALHHVALH